MTELTVLMLAAIAMEWAADNITVKPLNGRKMHRQLLFSLMLFLMLAIFIGLRTHYNDSLLSS